MKKRISIIVFLGSFINLSTQATDSIPLDKGAEEEGYRLYCEDSAILRQVRRAKKALGDLKVSINSNHIVGTSAKGSILIQASANCSVLHKRGSHGFSLQEEGSQDLKTDESLSYQIETQVLNSHDGKIQTSYNLYCPSSSSSDALKAGESALGAFNGFEVGRMTGHLVGHFDKGYVNIPSSAGCSLLTIKEGLTLDEENLSSTTYTYIHYEINLEGKKVHRLSCREGNGQTIEDLKSAVEEHGFIKSVVLNSEQKGYKYTFEDGTDHTVTEITACSFIEYTQ